MRSFLPRLFLLGTLALPLLTGCGSNAPSSSGDLTGNTNVTLLVSSTANDRFPSFGMTIGSLTLTNKSGKSVSLISSAEQAEFIRSNGTAAPLLTATVPQDVYTSATITLDNPYFSFVTPDPDGGIVDETFTLGGQVETPAVAIQTPITITGDTMVLDLNLLAAQSGTYDGTLTSTYTMTPTFQLTPVMIASSPTSAQNGKLSNLSGDITALSGTTFTTLLPGTIPTSGGIGSSYLQSTTNTPITVATNSSTVFQGVSNLAGLATGSLINFDAAIQSDGTLLATRVTAYDLPAQNLATGAITNITPTPPAGASPLFGLELLEQQGSYLSANPIGPPVFTLNNATFQTAPQITNVSSLPFTASFSLASLIPGQEVAVSTDTFSTTPGVFTPARTVTLVPQTIDGSIVSISSTGNFTVYTLALSSLDPIPVEGGPSFVTAYVAPDALLLNTSSPALNSPLRCTGLLFNDNGTLRMDCTQVNDGVTP
jgi:hypothetical protein